MPGSTSGPARRAIGRSRSAHTPVLLLTVSAVFGLVGSVVAGRVIHTATTRRVLQAGAAVTVLSLLVRSHTSGLSATPNGMRMAYLVTPVAVGKLAGTSLSVGDAIALFTLPAMVGLMVVTEWNEGVLRRRVAAVSPR